MTVGRRIWHML